MSEHEKSTEREAPEKAACAKPDVNSREARLAEALRANLRRRKVQIRGRSDQDETDKN